jgi:uncharacterized repeat protein (TIGR01451 family)
MKKLQITLIIVMLTSVMALAMQDEAPGPQVNLITTLTSDSNSILAGGALNYVIDILNEGPDVAENLKIYSPLYENAQVISAESLDGNCTERDTENLENVLVNESKVLLCEVAALGIGENYSVSIHLQFGDLIEDPTLHIEAWAISDASESNVGSSFGTLDLPVISRQADLDLTLSTESNGAQLGTVRTFSALIFNEGPDAVASLILTAYLPMGFAMSQTVGENWICSDLSTDEDHDDLAGLVIECAHEALDVGSNTQIDFVGQFANSPEDDSVNMSAFLTGDLYDPIQENNSSDLDFYVQSTAADLSIDLDSDRASLTLGDSLKATISASNLGPNDAKAVVVVAEFPKEIDVLGIVAPIGWECRISANEPGVDTEISSSGVVCESANFLSSEDVEFELDLSVVSLIDGTQLEMASTISSNTIDTNAENNRSSLEALFFAQSADLSVAIHREIEFVIPDESFNYAVEVHNFGPDQAQNLRFQTEMPSGMMFVESITDAWSCKLLNGADTPVLECTLEMLDSDSTQLVNIELDPVSAINGQFVELNAAIFSDTFDSDYANNSALDSILNIAQQADLQVTQEAKFEAEDELLTYTFSIENLGPNSAENIKLIATLPFVVVFQEARGEGWTCALLEGDGVAVECNISELTLGANTTIEIDAVIPAEFNVQAAQNLVTISSDTYDPNNFNNSLLEIVDL